MWTFKLVFCSYTVVHSERAFVFCIPCFKFERLRTSHNISVASGGAEGSDVNFNVAPRPSFLRSSGDSWALQYYTLAFTMILNFVACLGAKNSNVASDRCQVEFDDYCACFIARSRVCKYSVFLCIVAATTPWVWIDVELNLKAAAANCGNCHWCRVAR